MGIGVSLFLLAAGAILTFAIDVTTEGVNLDTIGVILMVVGGSGCSCSSPFGVRGVPGVAGRTASSRVNEK